MADNANTFHNANTFQFATKGAFDRSRASSTGAFLVPNPRAAILKLLPVRALA